MLDKEKRGRQDTQNNDITYNGTEQSTHLK